MPVVPPLSPEKAPESTKAIYERIKETIGNGNVSPGFQMMGNVEAFLQDSFMNYRKFIKEGTGGKLDAKQREALALATSSAMNCVHCVRHHAKEAVAVGWTDQEVAEILAITATCTMYNTLYRFRDLAGDPTFAGLSPGLRAFTFQKTSLGNELVELINIVVSSINGCHKCTSSHVAAALGMGLSHEIIDEAVKISATMASFNVFHRTQ